MSMTRQHFNAIAIALADSEAPITTINAISSVCKHFNPGFKRDRFWNFIMERRENSYTHKDGVPNSPE